MPDNLGVGDADLMTSLRAGSPTAMSELYQRHGRAAFMLAYSMLREQGAAEDIVQEAFLTLWRKADQYRPEDASLRTWLLTIVRNRTIDHLRSTRRARTDLPLLEELGETLGDTQGGEMAREVERDMAGQRVRAIVADLPEDQRRAVELVYFGGYTYEETARLTGAPLGTVKSRLRAAFARLRPLLAEEKAV